MMEVDGGRLVEQSKDIMSVKHVNNRVRYAKKTIKKRKRSSKKRRREVPEPEVLQQILVSCREIFKGHGTVPPASDVNKLCNILDKMKLEDIGLGKNQFFKEVGAAEGVTYAPIYQCGDFSLFVFFLPERAVIPLHNHPGMTVFSKLLLGKMHIKSYDWVDPKHLMPSSQTQKRLARLKANSVYRAPCDTWVLYPTTGGNIHEFRAMTACAVVDVVGPPYSKEEGRDCSYYRDFPYSEEGDCFGWLEEIEAPEHAKMERTRYMLPHITQNTTC